MAGGDGGECVMETSGYDSSNWVVCPTCGWLMPVGLDHTNCPNYWSTPQDRRLPYRCPVCCGSGLVSRPPHVAGDIPEWSSAEAGPWPCKACGGTGIVWG